MHGEPCRIKLKKGIMKRRSPKEMITIFVSSLTWTWCHSLININMNHIVISQKTEMKKYYGYYENTTTFKKFWQEEIARPIPFFQEKLFLLSDIRAFDCLHVRIGSNYHFLRLEAPKASLFC